MATAMPDQVKIRWHDSLACPACASPALAPSPAEVRCPQCGRAFPVSAEGVPLLTDAGAEVHYCDDPDPRAGLEVYGRYYRQPTFVEQRIREHGYRRVLSIGEGTGEYALALATKLPEVDLVAFDLDPGRIARAERLRRLLGIGNAYLLVADATRLPFRPGAFDYAYERGTFHILPDRAAHLAELRRLGIAHLTLTELANGRWFMAQWRLARQLARLLGLARMDLSAQRETEALLRRRGTRHGWRRHQAWLRSRGADSTPIWHDLGVARSYRREFPPVLARRSASFGLDVRLQPQAHSTEGSDRQAPDTPTPP